MAQTKELDMVGPENSGEEPRPSKAGEQPVPVEPHAASSEPTAASSSIFEFDIPTKQNLDMIERELDLLPC